MRRVAAAVILFALVQHGSAQTCPVRAPFDQMSLTAQCNVTSDCTAGTPITLKVDPFYGNCFPPSTWCGPGYTIQACDLLTWHFDDGTPDATATGASTIQHTFPNPKVCNVTVDIQNSLGKATVTWNPVVITSTPPTTITYSFPSTIYENDGTAVLTLTRGGNLSTSAHVFYADGNGFPDGTVLGPFRAMSGSATFAPGETTKTIVYPLIDDSIYTGDGGCRVRLSADDGTIFGSSTATNFYLMYVDDDPPPSLSIADARAIEGTGGSNAMEFNVTSSAPMGRDYYVSGRILNGTAMFREDYSTDLTGCTLARGTTSCKMTVGIVTDHDIEPDETFTTMIGPSYDLYMHPSVARGTATATIVNDDTAFTPSILELQPGQEGSLLFQFGQSSATAFQIAFTSQNPEVATVASPLLVGAGQDSTTVTVKAIAPGETTIHADGAEPALVRVRAAYLFLVQSPVSLITAADTALTISLQPARVTPETVTLSVVDPAIARAPQSITIPPGGDARVTLHGLHSGSTSLILNWVNGTDTAFGSVTLNVKDPARRRAM